MNRVHGSTEKSQEVHVSAGSGFGLFGTELQMKASTAMLSSGGAGGADGAGAGADGVGEGFTTIGM